MQTLTVYLKPKNPAVKVFSPDLSYQLTIQLVYYLILYIYTVKYEIMNNLVNLKESDPIFEEFKAFVDKNAGIKTIAFKYFGADVEKASEYLELDINEETSSSLSQAISLMQPAEYYQPELLH